MGIEERPSERIIAQRLRNRVMEYLELASSFEAQRDYELSVPIAHVPYEVINQWEDNFPRGPQFDAVDREVYTADEIEALERFQPVWERTADAVSDDYPSLASVQAIPEWDEMRRAASEAAALFARRGMLPEDHEIA